MRSTPLLEEGCILAQRYQIVRLVGQGGMGAVYLARDLRLPAAQWAVKEMWPHALGEAEQAAARLQFEREANLLASLSHPHLPRVTDFFSEEGRQYLVMEFVEGRTLSDIVEYGGAADVASVVSWGLQLCDLLEFLHHRPQPIIFRDVKPANIMIAAAQQVKVIDFGIARLYAADKTDDTISLGTPGFAAPEQYGKMGQSDARSDIYGLGATLHYALTAQDPQRTPFRFEPPSTKNPSVSQALDAVILAAVKTDSQERWSSAAAMAEALRQAVDAPAAGTVQLPGSRASSSTASPLGPATTRQLPGTPIPLRIEPAPLVFAAIRRGEQQRRRFQIVGDVDGLLVVAERKWLRVDPPRVRGSSPYVHVTLYAGALPAGKQHSTTIELRDKGGSLTLPVDIELDSAGTRGWLEFTALVCTIATLVPLLGVLAAGAVVILYLASRYEERLALRLMMLIATVLGALNAFLCLEAFFFFRSTVIWLWHRLGF